MSQTIAITAVILFFLALCLLVGYAAISQPYDGSFGIILK